MSGQLRWRFQMSNKSIPHSASLPQAGHSHSNTNHCSIPLSWGQKWLYVPKRVTQRRYTERPRSQCYARRLSGVTSLNGFLIFYCPKCGQFLECEPLGLCSNEPLGPDPSDGCTVVLGWSCTQCEFSDLVRIEGRDRDGAR